MVSDASSLVASLAVLASARTSSKASWMRDKARLQHHQRRIEAARRGSAVDFQDGPANLHLQACRSRHQHDAH